MNEPRYLTSIMLPVLGETGQLRAQLLQIPGVEEAMVVAEPEGRCFAMDSGKFRNDDILWDCPRQIVWSEGVLCNVSRRDISGYVSVQPSRP